MTTVSPAFQMHFSREVPAEEINQMFLDPQGRLDACYFGDELSYALDYVSKLSSDEQQHLVDRTGGDTVAFRYFAAMWDRRRFEAPYSNKQLQATYWTSVSIVLAQLFRYVQSRRTTPSLVS